MQEIIIDWSIIFSLISLGIAIAVFIDSRMKERTRKKERMIEALSECQTVLEEAIIMHPDLNYIVGFVMTDEFAAAISKKADALTELSRVCTDLGEDILEGASILKSTVRVKYAAADGYLTNKERSESLEKIKNLRDKIDVYLKKLMQ